MFALTAPRPLIGRIIPDEGPARWAANAALVVAGSLALWVSAKIQVPFYPVPMTLQTLAIMVIAASFGLRLGVATVLLYLAEGAFGLPVFAGTPEKGIGLAYMMGSTGGYLAGYVIAVALVGWLAERGFDRNVFKLFGAMFVGDVIVFALGLLWLGTLLGWDKPILAWGLYPFILGDLTKIALAASAVVAGRRIMQR
ncbi:MAG TPA: biotin transporter BioY [Afifellaceae bacterium]|nr:biotin transporter BioY [Afifellaceae bacterium]